MQGNQVEESVLAALDCINARISEFDVVVIIRGGGAASDLSGFDTYLLAAACAQFPLPVITGIGHERDDTVLDSVAHTRVKTPTAAAELLIQRVGEAAERLEELSSARSLYFAGTGAEKAGYNASPYSCTGSSEAVRSPFYPADSPEGLVAGDAKLAVPSAAPAGTIATARCG
jgi:hypothetical protein